MGNNRTTQRRKHDTFTSPSSSFLAPIRPFAPPFSHSSPSLSAKDLPASPEHPKGFGHSIERMTIHRPEPEATTENESEPIAPAETTNPSTFQLASDTETLAEQDQPIQTAPGTAPLATSSRSALQRLSVSAGDPVLPPPPVNRQVDPKRSGWSLERMAITREHLSPVQRYATSASRTPDPSSQQAEVLQQEPVEPVTPKENMTGLPDRLKSGVESLSGLSLDDVHVHYNSSKPAEVDALAYTQGSEIHVGPGQEKHLAHEAWHVVQQKEGRVQPTLQARGVAINDDVGLEKEADVMGEKAFRALPSVGAPVVMAMTLLPETIQLTSAEIMSWLQADLTSLDVKKMLQVNDDALRGLQDISASQAKLLFDILGKDILNAVSPTVNGTQLMALIQALGEEPVKDFASDLMSRSGGRKISRLATIANNLEAARSTEGVTPKVIGPRSIVVDSNTIIAIEKLVQGDSWGSLAPSEQATVNRIRDLVGLPKLVGDPTGTDFASIVGDAQLVNPNTVLGEVPPITGLRRSSLELTVDRNSAQYIAVLNALKNPPRAPGSNRPPLGPVGGRKGALDRTVVADAIFARTSSTTVIPQLITADVDVYARLAFFAPAGTVPRNNSVAEAIKLNYPNGFIATIAGKQLKVIPIFS